MTTESIIEALKAMPNRDVFQIAKILKLTPLEVSREQHEYLKKFRKRR